jgi:hypothetical protein
VRNLVPKRRYFSELHYVTRSRVNTVVVVTGYGLDDRGVRVRVPVWLFSDAVSKSDYVASEIWMTVVNELEKDMEGSVSGVL